MKPEAPEFGVSLGSLKLKNPVMTASGTFGYGREYSSLVDVDQLGGIIVKGISLRPMPGNPPPRIVETPCGMLNAIGLANIGIERFLEEKLPWLRSLDTTVILNIYGQTMEEYARIASAVRGVTGVDALEVNVSCPNVDSGGMAFGTNPSTTAKVTEQVLKNSEKPVIVKLTPNVTDIVAVAKAAQNAGAEALSLINTLTGMSIDIEKRKPSLGNISGGLSGPAIRPVALFMVYQVAKEVHIPVIGIGGIMDYRDALQFLIAGACAVEVGTANFVNPRAAVDIVAGLKEYCLKKGIHNIREIVGSLQTENEVVS